MNYYCDDKHGPFSMEQIKDAAKLVDSKINFNQITPMLWFVFMNKDKTPMSGSTVPQIGDYIIVCPTCGKEHYFGMDSD